MTLEQRIHQLEAANAAKELELGFYRAQQARYMEQIGNREQRLALAESRVTDAAAALLAQVGDISKTIVAALTNADSLKAYKEAIRDSGTTVVSNEL